MEIPPTHYAASRAASVAENCINYQQGTPHKLFLVQTVQQASKEVSLRGEALRSAPPTAPTPSRPRDPALPLNSIAMSSPIWDSSQNCLLSR